MICRALLALLCLGLGGAAAVAASASAPRWGQLTELVFQHLTLEHGLPNAITTALVEDGDGFLWVGTVGGLARWDGYRFRVYEAQPGTPGSLPDNMVQVLHRDPTGQLWIGTSAAGLVRHDRRSDGFTAIGAGSGALSHVSVRSIVDDGAGGLWVATDGGLDHLDPRTGAIRRGAGQAVAGLDGDRVNTLLRDRDGALWAGSTAGLFKRAAGAASFVAQPLPVGPAATPQPRSLFQDSQGRVWVGTLRHGAFVVEGGVARRVHATPEPGAERDGALEGTQINGIAEGQRGEIWIATAGQGVVLVDTASGHTHRLRHRVTLPMTLPDNAVQSLYRDRSGLMWVAGNRGLSRHDTRQQAVLTMFGLPPEPGAGLPARDSTDVSWVLPAPDGRVWLGTHKHGVHIVDPQGAGVGALAPDASRPLSALPQDNVLALERVADGHVFIGTKRGLYRATADGRRVERVPLPGRDPEAASWALLADGDTLWVGGQLDGLWRLHLPSGRAERMLQVPGPNRLTDERIVVIARAGGGALWVGTRNGLNRYDPASGAVQRVRPEPDRVDGLSAAFVTALHTDADGRLWVATYGGGVNILQPALETEPEPGRARFRRLTRWQGLPDDNVNALVADDQGLVWVGTDGGLARVDPRNLATRALRRAEGVVFPTYWTGAAARTEQGELLFGGGGGLSIVRPARLQPWTHKPATVITDIRVGGQPVQAGRHAGASAATLPALVVPAQANSLAVEFAAMDYSAPERNRYAYRLEGFDKDWIEADANRRVAAYTNLPPGDYRLLLRGSNRNGDWGDSPRVLAVHVQAAWHQALWFRGLLAAGALLLLWAVVQGRTRYLRAQQGVLETKVRERTAELEEVSRALEEKTRVLEHSAISDPLTGLRNRRFLAQHIDAVIAASLRRAHDHRDDAGTPADTDTVFLLIDVDHFKAVNDSHGHAAGDAVLVQFAARLQQVVRASDFLVRWGGEEFLAVACDTDRQRAEELAQRIRAVVADTPFALDDRLDDGQKLSVTCSIGFASLPFLAGDPRALDWEDVIQLADLALYAAKRAGRNAWMGLYAGPAARAQGLVQRVQTMPQQALLAHEIVLASSHAQDTAEQALTPN